MFSNPGKTLLIIEDEFSVRKSIVNFFEDSGFNILQAENGEDGLETYYKEKPDIVFTDLRMPKKDGLEVIAAIAKEDPNLPIIVVSGTGVLSDAIEAVRLGAWDYVTKPIFDMAVLEHVANKALERAEFLAAKQGYQDYLEKSVKDRTADLKKRTLELEEANKNLRKEMETRKKAERAHLRLVTAVEHSAESIIVTNANWEIIYVNKAFEQMTGYSRDEAQGKNLQAIQTDQNHDYYDNIRQAVIKDGLWKSRRANKKKDNTTYYTDTSASVVKDEQGEIVNYLIVQHDATHEIELEARLRQAQKMEAIGTLAGGIAHDFNNILSAIIGYNDLAMCDAKDYPEINEKLEKVSEAGQRATDLVGHILSFSRRTEEKRHPLPLQPIIKEVLKLLHGSLPATIEIRSEVNNNCGMVLADSTQIHQVIMNLCTNSFHAMRDKGGVLEVNLNNRHIDAYVAQKTPNLRPGEYAVLTVKDSGAGMDAKTIERIFDPYFTTKEIGEGTGLGLSTVHGIVQSHDGAIDLKSKPGQGALFNIYFPVFDASKDQSSDRIEESGDPLGDEHVLIVDDEEAIVDLEKISLTRMGYTVDTCTNSLDALEMFRLDPGKYDVVVSDLTMPKLTGDQLAIELQKIRSDIPVILCTGSLEAFTKHSYGENSCIRDIIKKPTGGLAVARAIRRVLDAAKSHK